MESPPAESTLPGESPYWGDHVLGAQEIFDQLNRFLLVMVDQSLIFLTHFLVLIQDEIYRIFRIKYFGLLNG